ncbi:MAG: hypothetical protein Q7S23_02675 [bacterium]|nr:hypothetical protein [bacterium]
MPKQPTPADKTKQPSTCHCGDGACDHQGKGGPKAGECCGGDGSCDCCD